MSLAYTVKPLQDRAGFHGRPKRSPFDSSWSATLSLLGREVRALDGQNVIVEIDVLPGAIRLDGQLYANAKVSSPGVRLHMDTRHGHLAYETDAFNAWQDNVRAIALALEALRRVDRYQIGRGGEQYRGYLQLEAGGGATALGGMTRSEALSVLAGDPAAGAGDLSTNPDPLRRAYRRARGAAHPDRHDGDRGAWDRVEQAGRLLGVAS